MNKYLWTAANAVAIDLVNANWFIAQLGLICSNEGTTFHHSTTLRPVAANVQNWQEISQMQRNADSVFCLQSPKELWYVKTVQCAKCHHVASPAALVALLHM